MADTTDAPDAGAATQATPSMDPAVTLADVARLAAVSTATATRALHGNPAVTPSTRARVEVAATALGYVPHLGARALAVRTTQTIGLLVPSTADMLWGEVTAGLEERALAAGFSVLLATSHGDAGRERAMIELFLGKRADGIVIGSAAGVPETWFPRRRPASPFVLVDWDTPLEWADVELALDAPVDAAIARIEEHSDTPFRHVRTDDVDGGRCAVDHLVGQGHRRIAFAGVEPTGPALRRLLGARRALDAAGLALQMAVPCDPTLEGGRSAGELILAAVRRPTAVVAFDDVVAVGIIHAVHAHGLRVPDDLSVVGFDDIPVAAFVAPPLTTYAQPKQALGALAVEVILDELRGASPTRTTILAGKLVVRRSTGIPPTD